MGGLWGAPDGLAHQELCPEASVIAHCTKYPFYLCDGWYLVGWHRPAWDGVAFFFFKDIIAHDRHICRLADKLATATAAAASCFILAWGLLNHHWFGDIGDVCSGNLAEETRQNLTLLAKEEWHSFYLFISLSNYCFDCHPVGEFVLIYTLTPVLEIFQLLMWEIVNMSCIFWCLMYYLYKNIKCLLSKSWKPLASSSICSVPIGMATLCVWYQARSLQNRFVSKYLPRQLLAAARCNLLWICW